MKTFCYRFGLTACCLLAACIFSVVPAGARTISVNLALTPADARHNSLATALAVTALNNTKSDSDTSTLTGNILANLNLSLNPFTHAVIDVNAVEFTGGIIHMSDVSFSLSYGWLLGSIKANSSNVAGVPDSPSGPGPVVQNLFNTIDHIIVFNQGTIHASGTGIIGGLFEPITQNLADDPLPATSDSQGTLAVALQSVMGNQAIYSVDLILPVVFDQTAPINDDITVSFAGSGTIAAAGTFTVTICPLRSNLAGDDCRVDLADLAVFSAQWLASSDQIPCPLTADLDGQNCLVNLDDLAILILDWLAEDLSE